MITRTALNTLPRANGVTSKGIDFCYAFRFLLTHWCRYWVNDGPKLVIISLFVLLNIGLFVERVITYRNGPIFPLYGYGICFARGSAQCLKLCCALILLPV